MTTERRWSEDGAPDAVRSLLESAVIDEPTEAQLSSLRARVEPLFTLPPPPPAPPVAAASSLAGKIIVGALLVALGGAALLFSLSPSADSVPAVTPTPTPTPTPAPTSTPTAEPLPPPPAVVVAPVTPVKLAPPKPATPPTATEPKPVDSIDEELALLQAAMSASSSEESLALVEQHVKRFPQSTLEQEREVLAIKALVTLTRTDDARARAAKFRERWPTSPHLLRVESLVGK
ncbi:MAG: hypothetical protein QM817_27995 [Archangium sp.]